jgi:hypothetical protein
MSVDERSDVMKKRASASGGCWKLQASVSTSREALVAAVRGAVGCVAVAGGTVAVIQSCPWGW